MSLTDNILRHLLKVSSEPDLSGTHYELVGVLGRGAMGVVYAVHDRRLQRNVALKVLHSGGLIEEEARIVASLEHPGIVPIHETGTLADGRSYYTMRLLEGQSLDVHFTTATPLSERLRVFQKICETVAFAHSRGVLHRDLKPRNIMAGPFGEVVILDWGIARKAAEPERPGIVAGTPKFMAPEVAAGDSHLADHRADIFFPRSLARVFRARVGTAPFAGHRRQGHERTGGGSLSRRARAEPGNRPVPRWRSRARLSRECPRKARSPRVAQQHASAATGCVRGRETFPVFSSPALKDRRPAAY